MSQAPSLPAALPSMRRRLSRLLVVVALGWGMAVSLAVWLALAHEVDELLDDTLRDAAKVLVALLEPALPALPARPALPALPSNPSLPPLPAASGAGGTPGAPTTAGPESEHFAWQLLGPGGEVLLRSPRSPEKPLLPLPLVGFSDTGQWRVYGLRFVRGDQLLYVAQTRTERREAQAEVALASVLAALAVGLLSAAWLRNRIRRELEPLEASTAALQHYEPLQPGEALQHATRAELEPMHRAIAALGARLAQRVADERAFSAHAAHALRTPLAGLDAQLAVALRELEHGADARAIAARMSRMRQATERLARVVSALLAMFRSGGEPDREAVDVAALLAKLPLDGLAVHVAPGTQVHAQADLLAAALLNLLDNSLRLGATTVAVSPAAAGGLVLEDNGPGIAEDRRRDLQDALDTQHYEGRTGLGLMLADRVARAHGGVLRLHPSPAGGARVELVLGVRGDRTPV